MKVLGSKYRLKSAATALRVAVTLLAATLGLVSAAGDAVAQQAYVYNLTSTFSAPFRCAPTFTGRMAHVESYSCSAPNDVIYTASYPVQRVDVGRLSDRERARWHIEGLFVLLNRQRFEIVREFYIGQNFATIFSASYEQPLMPGIQLEKHGVVVIKGQEVYQWTVTGMVGVSDAAARADFYTLVGNVLVR